MTNQDQPEAEETKEQSPKTEWHLLFAVEQDLALTPVGVGDVSVIADITGLTIEQVNAIIADFSNTESK